MGLGSPDKSTINVLTGTFEESDSVSFKTFQEIIPAGDFMSWARKQEVTMNCERLGTCEVDAAKFNVCCYGVHLTTTRKYYLHVL